VTAVEGAKSPPAPCPANAIPQPGNEEGQWWNSLAGKSSFPVIFKFGKGLLARTAERMPEGKVRLGLMEGGWIQVPGQAIDFAASLDPASIEKARSLIMTVPSLELLSEIGASIPLLPGQGAPSAAATTGTSSQTYQGTTAAAMALESPQEQRPPATAGSTPFLFGSTLEQKQRAHGDHAAEDATPNEAAPSTQGDRSRPQHEGSSSVSPARMVRVELLLLEGNGIFGIEVNLAYGDPRVQLRAGGFAGIAGGFLGGVSEQVGRLRLVGAAAQPVAAPGLLAVLEFLLPAGNGPAEGLFSIQSSKAVGGDGTPLQARLGLRVAE